MASVVPRVHSFCWCMGLDSGVRVVAVIHLMISLITVCVCGLYAAEAFELWQRPSPSDPLYRTMFLVAVGVLVLSVGHILLAALLIYAAFQRSSRAAYAWVMVNGSLLVAAVVSCLVNLAKHPPQELSFGAFFGFVEGALAFFILGYFIVVVHSFYLTLKESADLGESKFDY